MKDGKQIIMTDKTPVNSDKVTDPGRPRALYSILYGGLAVGVLDFLDAIIFFGLRGSTPRGIFQYVASGLLGRAAFSGGTKTFALGLLLHFLNAFIFTTIYYFASLGPPTF